MIPKRVFDAEGYWIAFVVGREVFLRGGEWLGRMNAESEIRDDKGQLRGILGSGGCLSVVEPDSLKMSA